ncbi:MAG: polymer-forming cytoskeletal protein [Salibacteraceae bacterium]
MARNNDTDAGIHNQIAKGTVIKGDIQTDGVIRIDGTLDGSIVSKGKIVVGPTGRITGEIKCQSANISGVIDGKITVGELLSLQASAKLNGEVVTDKLSIEPGALFNANCKMGGVVKEINHGDKKKRLIEAEQTA